MSPPLTLSFFPLQIADLANEDTPQLYVACGRGPRSTLRVLRHGLEVCACLDHLLTAYKVFPLLFIFSVLLWCVVYMHTWPVGESKVWVCLHVGLGDGCV